ncbi:MAG: DNA topoisomerase IV subunit A [Tenericutes bacterium]|nr:DNA topoisomerase IV subunit A [Mycoplasmatota bacterium]MDD6941745.1 DNA topoisomerase IV subunit A [bacterium]MDY2697047.1 DNA topoisomerase IV subunit A [Bacilli bacterium]
MAKTKTEEIIEKIFDYTLEDIMGERFGSYSKYIIQDRAIPDARDGLKPVQRRILYSMYKEKNTYDHGYRKSAKTVGDVIGNYHPHGDSSIYDAMVRMSQPWKTRLPYIDMHGNNGSIDGDSPAAYRYTEARLSKISNEMLRDIDKNTVEFAPNFDDTTVEPTVLPARFPALLVYGAQGISAGYATNIPPHNLGEIIEATIYRVDHPDCTLEELMQYVKGPDFPTGAIVEGIDGIKDAYTTGRGKINIKSKYTFEEEKGKLSLVITEIPFETNKALLVKKIDDIRIDKKIDGIVEVRDESAADVRVVIDLKKTANKELIINYLLKNTDMQISYNFNMVSIVNRRPKLLGLAQALDAFIIHQKDVVKRRTEFDLAHAKARYHIVEGLIKCISILDEVIKVIRASKNKQDAKMNLVKEFEFTEEQAEAIVVLQLYRLTNTDVVALENEKASLEKIIKGLSAILGSEEVLKSVMKKDLNDVKENYPTPRITEIKDQITEIKIDTTAMIPKEDVVVLVTKDGYIKRTSFRSYTASNPEDITIKENDYIIGIYEMNTTDTLLLFTTSGNYLHIPVHIIPDLKWKDMPKHVSNIIEMSSEESIVSSIPAYSFESDKNVIIATHDGMIKRSKLKEFKLQRYSKATSCMKLKDNDYVIASFLETSPYLFLTTDSGYGLSFKTEEVPVVGVKASGVKGIKLKDDNLVSVNQYDPEKDEFISIITEKGTGKRVRLSDFEVSTRTRRGLQVIREVKTNPYKILKTFITDSRNYIGLKNSDINKYKLTELPISDRHSTGSQITKHNITDAYLDAVLVRNNKEQINLISEEEVSVKEEVEEVKPKKERISLKEIDDRLMTIDDFLK